MRFIWSRQPFYHGIVNIVEIIDEYKYLGVFLREHLDFKSTRNKLEELAKHWVVSFKKSFKHVEFKTFSKVNS